MIYTIIAIFAILVTPAVFIGSVLDLIDADDAKRDYALGIRQLDLPIECPDSARILPLIAARELVTQ